MSTAATPPAEEPGSHQAGTRERILRAAIRLIADQGIAAISNRRLAAEAGVALGSLTYHFPSQTELLRESLALYVNDECERLGELVRWLRNNQPPLETIAQTVERAVIAGLGTDAIAEFELHMQAARDPELREASRRCYEARDEVATAALEAVGVEPTPERAHAVVALVNGFAMRRLGSGEMDVSGLAHALLAVAGAADAEAAR